jgi:hypothetical protein
MVEASNDLMLEILKSIPPRMGVLEEGQKDLKNDLIAIRGHMIASQSETNNLHSRLGSVENRLDRIEKRLGMIDVTIA